MKARDLMDGIRENWVENDNTSPTRSVVYTRDSDQVEATPNSFVGGGLFNQEEKDNIKNYQSFGGLKLSQEPKVGDTVTYDGTTFKVERFTKLGTLYQVFAKQSRHNVGRR